jgi:hypothetical protein
VASIVLPTPPFSPPTIRIKITSANSYLSNFKES